MNPTDTAFPVDELLAHRPWVRSLARSLVRDEHAAADLEQDTWVRALERPPERRESPRGWLGTVLRNRRRDTAKMEARRATRERSARPERATDGPAEMAAKAELHRRVIDHVLALDEPYRATVLYRFFEGLSPAEIAAREGVNASTVRSRLARALEQLRERMDAENGRDGRAWRAALLPLLASGDGAAPVPPGPSPAVSPLVMAGIAGIGVVAAVLCVMIPQIQNRGAAGPAGDAGPAAAAASPDDGKARAPRGTGRRARRSGSESPSMVADGAATGEDAEKPDTGPPSVAAELDPATAVITVLDAAGRPVEGAALQVVNPFPPGKIAYGLVLFTGTSGSDGKVAVTSRLSRDVGLIARKDGLVGERRMSLATVDEVLTTSVRLGPALRVTGRLLGVDDRPVEGARVTLADEHLAAIRHVTSKRDGSFVFDDVPDGIADGEPTIYAEARGYVNGEAPLELAGRVASPVTVRLTPAVRVTGRCVDEEGRPIAEVFVTAPKGRETAETGKDGRFVVGGVPLDAVEIDFQCMSHAARRLVHDGAEPGVLDLGDVVLSRGGTIRGVVVLPDGTPVAKATVHLESLELDQFVGQAQTDADGAFTLERVGTGPHNLHASGPGGGARWASGPEGRADGVSAGTSDLRIVATRANSLHIELIDGKTGKAVSVPSVKVKLHDPAGEAKPIEKGYWSDAMESVRVAVRSLGPFDVEIEVPGYAVHHVKGVELHADRETPLKVKLARAQ